MDTVQIGIKNNALFVKRGDLFTGSTYDIDFAGAESGVLLRLYWVKSTLENAVCVAETVYNDSTQTHTLALTASTWHDVFEANSFKEQMTCKAYLYNAEGDIVASGEIVVKMSPTKGVYDGKPVDVVGPTGATGAKGNTGDKGDKGDTGDKGAPGEDGLTYTPSIRETADGAVVDWTGSDGTTISGTVNIKGATGPKGQQGVQGVKGDTGAKGDQGPKGDTGDTGATGPKGDNGLSAYQIAVNNGYTGSESDYIKLLEDAASSGAVKAAIDTVANVVASQARTVATAQSSVLNNTALVKSLAGTVDTKVTELNTKVDAAVKKAEDAADDIQDSIKAAEEAQTAAETAQHGAEEAQTAAETALNNGCVYEVREVDSSAIQLAKTLTAYKHTPTADAAYTFTAPEGVEGKIIVFWLWVIMGETVHQLTFPAGVTWISEGSFAANTETLIAFMSVDGGATWSANKQWEVA